MRAQLLIERGYLTDLPLLLKYADLQFDQLAGRLQCQLSLIGAAAAHHYGHPGDQARGKSPRPDQARSTILPSAVADGIIEKNPAQSIALPKRT